jgi:hypothetical protein
MPLTEADKHFHESFWAGMAQRVHERTAAEVRAKDEQTRRVRLDILASAIASGVASAPDAFPVFDARSAAALIVDWLGQ